MITSIVILMASVGLFVYWFRYTCLLILSARTSRDYAQEVAIANQLQFVAIQSEIETITDREQLDELQRSLQRDYETVTGLLRHTRDLTVAGTAVEDIMLKIDYRIMAAWYSVARSASPRQAAAAASEMCQIVSYFANLMGERAVSGSEA